MFLQGWSCTQVFEGHSHYVMQVALNPKDTNTFASASLDRTVKVRLERLYTAMPAAIYRQLLQNSLGRIIRSAAACVHSAT